MLSRLLNCGTLRAFNMLVSHSSRQTHLLMVQCMCAHVRVCVRACASGRAPPRCKTPRESALPDETNGTETPCTGLQWGPCPTWGLATKPTPRNTAGSQPSGCAMRGGDADEGLGHVTLAAPFMGKV